MHCIVRIICKNSTVFALYVLVCEWRRYKWPISVAYPTFKPWAYPRHHTWSFICWPLSNPDSSSRYINILALQNQLIHLEKSEQPGRVANKSLLIFLVNISLLGYDQLPKPWSVRAIFPCPFSCTHQNTKHYTFLSVIIKNCYILYY